LRGHHRPVNLQSSARGTVVRRRRRAGGEGGQVAEGVARAVRDAERKYECGGPGMVRIACKPDDAAAVEVVEVLDDDEEMEELECKPIVMARAPERPPIANVDLARKSWGAGSAEIEDDMKDGRLPGVSALMMRVEASRGSDSPMSSAGRLMCEEPPRLPGIGGMGMGMTLPMPAGMASPATSGVDLRAYALGTAGAGGWRLPGVAAFGSGL
ncbi:hypothetical protein HK101_004697, partial [Irineochytrium annulatum]